MSNRLDDPPAIKISIQRMVCTGCGAEANASCNCGQPYLPKTQRAKEAIEANPGKSDRAIAAEIGASPTTVGKARAELSTDGQLNERTGLDGKTRRPPRRVTEAIRQQIWDRFEEGKTQQQIAAEFGISQATVSHYLIGDRGPRPVTAEEIETDRQECIALYKKVTDVEGEMAAAVNKIRQDAVANYLGDGDIVERALTLIAKMDDGERQRFDAAYTLRFCDPVLN